MQDKRKVEKNKDHEKLRQDFNEVFNTKAGQRVLSFLIKECGYQNPTTVFNPTTSEIVSSSTLYQEARRTIYLRIRQFIKPEILRIVENPMGELENE